MARTIPEIKQKLTDAFIADETVKNLYELEPLKTFEEQFSKISLESILFYIVATCTWTLEMLFDRHKKEVTELISQLKPHTLLWYVNKAKAYQSGDSLIADTDLYDNRNRQESEISNRQIVKYAAAEEKGAVIYIKVATGETGKRQPLNAEQKDELEAYFSQIKDAGVKLQVDSLPADTFNIDIDIYYDPQIYNNTLNHNNPEKGQLIHDTIASFVENLPFNGEYRNSALIQALLNIEGIVLVELNQATANGEPINARWTPKSGYFKVDKANLKLNPIAYEPLSK